MAIEHINEFDTLNAGREKINKHAIDPANRAESNSIDAKNVANQANQTSQSAEAIAVNTDDRLDNIIAGEMQDGEVIDARRPFGGEAYPTLGERLDENDSLLKKITKNNTGDLAPAITFIDDDGARSVYTKLLPIAKRKNIPYGIAFINNHLNDLSLAQLNELKENGFEILNHGTDAITDLLVVDDLTAEAELIKSKKWLKDNGFTDDIFVYSMGRVDSDKRKIVSKYNRCAFDTSNTKQQINTSPIDTYNITRVNFGLDGYDFNYYKDLIDETKKENGWLVFYQHCWYPDFTEDKILLTEQVVDYARSVGVDVVSPSDGFERFGNIVDLGIAGVEEESQDSYFYLGKKGHVKNSTNLKFLGAWIKKIIKKYSINSDVSEFEKGAVSKVRFYNDEIDQTSNVNDPSSAGTLEVSRDNMDDAFSYRFWHGYNQNDELYYSVYNKGLGWGNFNPVFDKHLPDNTITINTKFNSGMYAKNRIFYCYLTGENVKDFPFGNSNGLVIVDAKVRGRRNSVIQTFIDLDSKNQYVRYYNISDDSWTAWSVLGVANLRLNKITPNFNPIEKNVYGLFKCIVSGANATDFGLTDVGIVTIDSGGYDGSNLTIAMSVQQRATANKRYAHWDDNAKKWTDLKSHFNRYRSTHNVNATIAGGATVYRDIAINNTALIFDDTITCNPKGSIQAGLVYNYWVLNGSTLRIAITNITATQIVLNIDFSVSVIK